MERLVEFENRRKIRGDFLNALIILAIGLMASSSIRAQTNSYTQTNLVSDTPGMARVTDPNLINPWGISFFPGTAFWIADNNSGLSTLYDAQGNVQQLVVTIPPPHGVATLATPTGTVANASQGFAVTAGSTTAPSLFIFDTEDGTISGWNGTGTNAVLAVDNSAGGSGAVYKGLALDIISSNPFLLASNFRAGTVEVYDANFHVAQLAGNFTDPTIPAGFAPFGIHVLNNQVVVTYAMQDAAKHDPVNAPGNGFVSLFDANGNFIRRIASNTNLNSPWGAVMAPAGFGAFAGQLLIGNFGDGTIDAYNLGTGAFLGQLQDAHGAPIVNASLWDMVFGLGGTGDPNTLYFTAGLANEQHGLFATLTANNAPPAPSQDFTIGATPQSATISAGGSATFTVSLTPVNGFSTATTLSCSGLPALATCSFSPNSVTPQGASAATTTLTISTRPPGYTPAFHIAGSTAGPAAIVGLMLLSLSCLVFRRKGNMPSRSGHQAIGWLGLTAAIAILVFLAGCGGYNSKTASGTPTGASTVMVTATAGAVTHTTSIAITVK